MNNFIPIDIFKEIFLFGDFLTKISFRQICKYSYNNLHIIDFYYIEETYLSKLTDDILKNYKFTSYLNASNNPKIKDVSWMKNLK